MNKKDKNTGLYIMMISVHGLIRSRDLELGRDPDTGGQVLYVVELAKALAHHPQVSRVDLLTRQIIDPKVDACYSKQEEEIVPGAYIVRIPCGPRRYLRKEVLWPYLDNFVDGALSHLRHIGRLPDWIHSHYADAGYAGVQLSNLLGVPLIHTGHSLGRDKRIRLLDKGMREDKIEERYNISRRINAEELVLENASLIITSTSQEKEEQYRLYDNYYPKKIKVLPPGTDLERFSPPMEGDPYPAYKAELDRFLKDPDKPMILALSRPDGKKNLGILVKAFGENRSLRNKANLVIIAGTREDIREAEKESARVLTSLLLLIDRYDLYGSVAYPKMHTSEDVPDIYRIATGRHLESALDILQEWGVPTPDVLITSVGSEIYYGTSLKEDKKWRSHINYRWEPEQLWKAMEALPGIRPQEADRQRDFKLSFYVDPRKFSGIRDVKRYLQQQGLLARLVYCHQTYLDLLPVRASKGLALRYIIWKWGLPARRVLTAGDSGNDREMLNGDTLGVVVGNYSPELLSLKDKPSIYFAEGKYARGIIEGIRHYDFLGKILLPEESTIYDEERLIEKNSGNGEWVLELDMTPFKMKLRS